MRRVAGRADAGVQDDRHPGRLDDQLDVVRVADAQARADRRAQRHHRRAARLLQPAGQHRVVGGVGQHREPVGDQLLGRGQQLERVGQQGPLVGDDLELDPVGAQRLAGQPGHQDRLGRGEAARGVGQHPDTARRSARPAPSPRAAGSTRRMATVVSSVPDAARARSSTSRLGAPPVPMISRDVKLSPASDERVVHGQPPCTAVTTSTWSPAASRVDSHAPRRITSPLSAAATPVRRRGDQRDGGGQRQLLRPPGCRCR